LVAATILFGDNFTRISYAKVLIGSRAQKGHLTKARTDAVPDNYAISLFIIPTL
jgi:hypothetical protein